LEINLKNKSFQGLLVYREHIRSLLAIEKFLAAKKFFLAREKKFLAREKFFLAGEIKLFCSTDKP